MASGCDSCINPLSIPVSQIPGGCPGCGSGCEDSDCPMVLDSSCIAYTGPNLTCIGVTTNICLETILQKIDVLLCTPGGGNYSGYNLGCLRDTYTINTAQNFAEAISDFVCNLRSDFDSFVSGDFNTAITNLQNQINDILTPGITSCPAVDIENSDDLNTVLSKLAGAACNIYDLIDPSTANWAQCFTLIGLPPANIVEAFNKVIDYICTVQSSVVAGGLPTFNNVGTCLPSPGADDSLVNTISKIITRLCQTPTFNANNLTPVSCVQFSGASTLEDVLNSINNQLNQVSLLSIRAVDPAYFTLVDIDPLEPCLGKRLNLTGNIQDRFVALNNSDVSPGTLLSKIAAGTNITLDFGIANPGKLTISATGGAISDEKVKVTAGDPTADYLAAKLVGGSQSATGISISLPLVGSSQVQIQPAINLSVLIPAILDEIGADPTLKEAFCALVASCPSPCDAPSNVSVQYVP